MPLVSIVSHWLNGWGPPAPTAGPSVFVGGVLDNRAYYAELLKGYDTMIDNNFYFEIPAKHYSFVTEVKVGV